ncbi:MAG: DNA polymerase III subunit alpha [Candidatus Rhabdochlamydia sp.]
MTHSFIPLHVHSQYSILNSTASVEDLVAKAQEQGLKAIALTDEGNLYGAVEFYKACKGAGIKPLIGCELQMAQGDRKDKKRIPGTPSGFPILLLAKNTTGYHNLCKLSSLAHIEGFYYTPRIDKDLLETYKEGLICLSGPLEGRIPFCILQGKEKELEEEINWFQTHFGSDFYFQLERHVMQDQDITADGMEKEGWLTQNYHDFIRNQEVVIQKLISLGNHYNIKCVATQGVHYLERQDWKAHEILMNIQSGEPCEIWERDSQGNPRERVLNPKRKVLFSHEFYFKSPLQMNAIFKDIPTSLDTSYEIADKIDLTLDFKTKFYPVFTPPIPISKDDYLKKLCQEGIAKRYTEQRMGYVAKKYPGQDVLEVIQKRLDYELDIIISKEMSDYILIVHDFIDWAKKNGIPMGPGRGSGAGSIILFLIGITDIEPLRFNLFFERFINPERLSYPDIDVDICMERRDEVIQYTVEKYGHDKVAQIITFGTMKAKMAIKDVGRMLSTPLAKVNAIAKLVPEDLGITLSKALESFDLKTAYETDAEVREILDIAKRLEGCVRNTGIHAAGLIICGDPIMERIPVIPSKDSDILVTQFSMKPVESVGMLKVDFLGLKTLTSIQKTVDAIALRHGETIDWIDLDLEDALTFELMNQGRLNGIFQMESTGMQELSKQLHIDKFEEVIAVVALYRPGPMEMIPSFIQRKHGKEEIEIDHPLMQAVLVETYGIMVYQEQVMQIASLLANYSLGEGDVLRRAMGKKDKEEMARQRDKFQQGAHNKGIDKELALHIFDKIEKFASYGFNKSHAAAYGYLAYVTAYLKANYPGEWMAALLTCDKDDVTKVSKLIHECQSMDLPILPPDVNESGHEFVATSKGIRFAMSGIKGIGEGVVEAIIAERKTAGAYTSLSDFCHRIDTKKVGKKNIEILIEAGCFDFTADSRQAMVHIADPLYTAAMKKQKEIAKGWMDLFETASQDVLTPQMPAIVETESSKAHLLRREKELLGFYVTGHPLDVYRKKIERLSCVPFFDIEKLSPDTLCRVVFIVDSVQIRISAKTQKKFAILQISDGHLRFELPVWPDLFDQKGHLLLENQLLYAILQVEKKEDELKLQCKWFEELAQVNDQVVEECDQLFDKLRSQPRHFPPREKKQGKPVEKQEIISTFVLKLKIHDVKLSQLLTLKKLFQKFAGKNRLIVEFIEGSKSYGKIHIDPKWGILPDQLFEKEIKSIPSFVSFESLS